MKSIAETRTGSAIATAYRFTSGQHLDGMPRTNAGWVTRGTRPALPGGRVTRWSLLSRLERAGVRLGTAVAASGAVWGLQAQPDGTEQTLTGTAAAGALTGGYVAGEWAAGIGHRRNWVRPLHLALEGPLRLPAGTVPGSYLRIPRDYPARTDVGRIDLPPEFTGADAAPIASIVKTKLGLTDATVSFKLEGRRPHLLIRQTPRPPGKVMFADPSVREMILAASESAPLIGVGPKGSRVSVDLDAESPHILVSASTGGGKSVITRTMAAQMMHNGAQGVFLDVKRHSHKWARGLPNVSYFRDIEDIHDALVKLGQEGHRRNLIVDDWEGEEDPPVGPRMVMVLEEMNATRGKLKKYWSEIREKEDPKESPAIAALGEVLFMGRAVKMHVLAVAQSATANALGGPEMRECFATRILSRYTRNAWLMLVPEVQPVPRSTRHVGRAQVVLGGSALETQVAFYTDSEAREWASSGTVAAAPLGSFGHVTPSQGPLTSEDAAPGSRDVTPVLTLVKQRQEEPAAARYSLAAAAREGIVPLSADALRQAKRRDPEFPEGDGGKWTAAELEKWHRNRPGVKESTA